MADATTCRLKQDTKLSTGVSVALLLLVAGLIAIALPGEERWSVWALVACATALPAIAAGAAWQKAGRIGDREGLAWRIMGVAMALMAPIYLADFLGWDLTEDLLIYGAYLVGGVAMMLWLAASLRSHGSAHILGLANACGTWPTGEPILRQWEAHD